MGEFLSVPNKEKVSEDGDATKIRYAACGMQGWRKRMEDSHISDMNLLSGNVHVFGVFDGHGGEEVAQFVKKHFTEEIAKNPLFKSGDMQNALIENFLRIDEMLVEPSGKSELKKFAKISKEKEELQNQKEKNKQVDMFKQLFDPKGQEDCDIAMMTGCTAHVCIIDENQKKIFFANSGDSRGVLCRNGIAYAMSEDHKPDLDSEKARIYKADGWVSDGRVKGNLNLSRSLGDLDYKQNKKLPAKDQMITAYPELKVETLSSDCDFIILACDGVWDCLTNQEICDIVKDRLKKDPNVKLSKVIEDILDSILATDIHNGKKINFIILETGVGCDNMTCVIIQFKK